MKIPHAKWLTLPLFFAVFARRYPARGYMAHSSGAGQWLGMDSAHAYPDPKAAARGKHAQPA
jgi:hypothetical protein